MVVVVKAVVLMVVAPTGAVTMLPQRERAAKAFSASAAPCFS
jgi:hypothetical protein